MRSILQEKSPSDSNGKSFALWRMLTWKSGLKIEDIDTLKIVVGANRGSENLKRKATLSEMELTNLHYRRGQKGPFKSLISRVAGLYYLVLRLTCRSFARHSDLHNFYLGRLGRIAFGWPSFKGQQVQARNVISFQRQCLYIYWLILQI